MDGLLILFLIWLGSLIFDICYVLIIGKFDGDIYLDKEFGCIILCFSPIVLASCAVHFIGCMIYPFICKIIKELY